MLTIRQATIEDLEDITDIYNEAILKTVATFDTEIKTPEEQKSWFKDHGPKNPILIAVQDDIIVGWAALSKYSTRCAYSDIAEISLYIDKKFQDKGIGTKLMEAIIQEGEKAGLHAVIARITEGNKKSVPSQVPTPLEESHKCQSTLVMPRVWRSTIRRHWTD